MNTSPTTQQITEVANELRLTLGVSVSGSDVAFAVDAKFPQMTDEQFESVRAVCAAEAEKVRMIAMRELWGTSDK